MKNKFNYLLFFILTGFLATSCDNKETGEPTPQEPAVSYIVNYGNYSGDKSTITAFDKETGKVTNNYYENVNGVSMVSNVQNAHSANGKIYFAGNNPDQVFWVDGATFEQTDNGITEGIVKPRFILSSGNYLYVSCWGGEIWNDENVSYIAKINLAGKVVEKKLAVPGGPEGMAIANNKLYAALNYKDSVAVVDLITDEISYIITPAVSSYFLKDNNNNLYVSLISTFSDYSEETGLGFINTSSDKLENVYPLEGVSSSYVNILSSNNDFSKIYVMKSAYDANWNLSGAVAVFNVDSKMFNTESLVKDVSGMNGLAYFNDQVFCFIAETVTGNGKAITYQPDGTKADDFNTGIAPYMLITVR
jgi:hypothetical protein